MELKTWERKGYTVEMVDYDYDLKAFEVRQHDVVTDEIVPATIEDMRGIIEALDNGEEVDGWEDGIGNTIMLINDIHDAYDYIQSRYNIDGEDEKYAILFYDYEEVENQEEGMLKKLSEVSNSLNKLKYPIVFFDDANTNSGEIYEASEIENLLNGAKEYFKNKY